MSTALGTMPLPLAAPPGEPTAPVALAARSPVWWPSRRARWLLALPLLLVSIMLLGGKLSLGSPRVAFSDLQAASAATTATGSVTVPTTLPSATFAFSRLLSFPTATATPFPSPTATPVPPTATAVPPSRTPAPRIVAQAPSPQAAVLGFYQMVAAHCFDVATALWTTNLQAQNPPTQAINERYAQTDRITVQHWEVTAQTGDRATVAIAVSEYARGANTSKNYRGTWQFVHTDVGWLLNAQDMRPA